MNEHLLAALTVDIGKVWLPVGSLFAVLTIADVKDIGALVASLVAIVCTIMVSMSTIRKNNRANLIRQNPGFASEPEDV